MSSNDKDPTKQLMNYISNLKESTIVLILVVIIFIVILISLLYYFYMRNLPNKEWLINVLFISFQWGT